MTVKGLLIVSSVPEPLESVVKMASSQASRMFGWTNPHVLEVFPSRFGYSVVVSDDLSKMADTGGKTATVVAATGNKKI